MVAASTTSAPPPLTSASGVLSMLDEQDQKLQEFALKQLDTLSTQFWPEIADSIGKIELLYEDAKFPSRQLAALVASKVYFHLGEYDDSVTFALGAGKYFDIESMRTEFVETIVGKCIDKYIELKQLESSEPSTATTAIDSRLTAIVERMFQRCLDDKAYKQAVGISLECHRLDVLKQALVKGPTEELLKYTMDVCMTLVQNLGFRNQVLRFLVQEFQILKEPDYIAISHCLVWLRDADSMGKILETLVQSGTEVHLLMAYQICFDVYESATQEFLQKSMSSLPKAPSAPSSSSADNAMQTDDAPPNDKFAKVRTILSGELTIKLHLEFLYRNNKSDMLIMKKTKTALESRSSVYHSAITFAHAFMTAGTTNDQFLRDNLDWLIKASNWTKFTATAQLGVIHKGNLANSMNLLQPYLPKDGVTSSVYSEGGSLFALGLIHTNHGAASLPYLKQQLAATQDEVVQHGAALGLGAAGMATGDESIFEALKNVLHGDSAVAGEAAGYAMGLVMLGTGSTKCIEEMVQYAHETQHEKIIRGLAVGVAMILYGLEEKAQPVIQQMMADQDPVMRYGGTFAIALAYAGTSNNTAIRLLLHTAVSDVNDDVRRSAVMALGFVLVRAPKQVPRIVQLLSESYNPHVRYGSAMALGIACAGTGMMEALELLEPMTKDSVDFVRQGAFLAGAMILIQQNEQSNPKVASYRTLFSQIITEKHMEAMTRFGAVLGQGILDAGGRNVTLSLLSRNGHLIMESAVGVTLFLQHWYWYPLTHFLSLAFTPTPLIGLNKDLDMPKFEVLSNVKPSMFAYPPATVEKTEEKFEKVATAVLSTTAKAKSRAKKNDKGDAMDTDEVKTPVTKSDDAMAVDEVTPAVVEEKKKPEPNFEVLQNVSRVVPGQLKYLSFKKDARYVPVKKGVVGGIMLTKDLRPTEQVELVEYSTPKVVVEVEKKEAEAPAPFELED